jgi:hypothetical protein
MIPFLAKEPVLLSALTRIVFQPPTSVMPDPLTYGAILSLSDSDSTSIQSDTIQALYLQHERDTQDARICRFNRGDITGLQEDVGQELRVVLKLWVELWKKEMVKSYCTDTNRPDEDEDQSIDLVHLRWISRIANGLSNELFLLGTAQRRQNYLSSISTGRIGVLSM